MIANGPGVLLHAQPLVVSELVGIQTTPSQATKLCLVAGVVINRELLHFCYASIVILQTEDNNLSCSGTYLMVGG